MVARAHGRMVPEVERHMEAAGHVVEDIGRVGDRRTLLVGVRRREFAGMVLVEARHMMPVLVVEGMDYEMEHRTALVEDILIAVVDNLEVAHIQALVSYYILAEEDIGLQVAGRPDNPLDLL